jgi:hypothetical protein
VAALAARDRAALTALTPTPMEYAGVVFPELVAAGEPLLGSLGVQWGWDNLELSSRKGLKRMLEKAPAGPLTFVSISTGPNKPRGRLALFGNVVVKARTGTGDVVELPWIAAIVEREGGYKILRFWKGDSSPD